MNKKALLLSLVFMVPQFLLAEDAVVGQQDQAAATSVQASAPMNQPPKAKKRKKGKKTIKFSYTNEDIVNVINYLAAEKGVNIMLPHGANAITGKLTLNIDEKLTLDEAWDKLTTILDVAGYALFPRDDMYMVVKNSPNTS